MNKRIRCALARFSMSVLCALSLSVYGATEKVPQFGTETSYATITDKPSGLASFTMSAWFKVTEELGAGGDYDCIFGSCARNGDNGPMTLFTKTIQRVKYANPVLVLAAESGGSIRNSFPM